MHEQVWGSPHPTPALLIVHVDQLHRPVKMTSAAAAVVWSAVYSPFGGAYTITGAEANNARFPGQWFQLEAGLHYNWHRHYDASLGRYTQPDPLGFVDGPSVYAYARSRPSALVDLEGRNATAQTILRVCSSNPYAAFACACAAAIVYMANVVDTQILLDWIAAGSPPDRCKWLSENRDRYRQDQWKPTEKAWGCRHSTKKK